MSDVKRAQQSTSRGFTVVELLVIAPVVILTIGAFISVIVGMTGEVLATRASGALAYNLQDTLNRIEDDVKLSTTFLAETNVDITSPQGFNNDTTIFENVDNTNGDMLILNTLATTANPLLEANSLVYLANQPNACNSTEVTQNKPLTMNIVYFVKNDTATNVSSLWRRTIAPPNYTTIGCATPWQQPSCTPGQAGSYCVTQDVRLLDDVQPEDFVVQYFNTADASIENAIASDTGALPATRNAALQATTSVGVSLNVTSTAAGRQIEQSGSVRATKLDTNASVIADEVGAIVPVAPSLTATTLAPASVVFTWPSSPGATGYTFQYQINGTGGAWTTGFTNQNNLTFTVPAAHTDVVYGRVSATSSAGTSAYSAIASATIPLWATPLQLNNWSDYGSTYSGAAYTKTREGIVVLRGLIKRSGAAIGGEVLFQLPAGYRPNLRQIYTTMTNPNVASRIDVDADGSVRIQSGSGGYLSLDGIKFVPSSTSAIAFQPMTLSNSWVNYDAPTHQVASYARDTLNRTFTRGVIRSGSTTAASLITSLPSSPNYLSPSYLHLPNYNNAGFGFFSPAQTNTTYPGAGVQYKGGANGYYSIEGMFYNSYTGWTSLSLVNGWTWYSSTGIFATPAYTKAADGIVSLKGLITAGTATADTTFASLPVGFRPSGRLIFEVANNSAAGRVDVLPDGQVRILSGGNVWLALDNINFVAEQ